MSFDASVHAKAVALTKLNVEITAAAGSGHPTSGASLAHLVTVLMYDHMRHDPVDPANKAADRLVLSEGHAVPILYAAAADLGIVAQYGDQLRPTTREDVMQLRAIDSPIDGHPNPEEGFPFFDAATGSLGQGLSVSAGIAEAARLDGIDKRVFCLIGDGESREGQIWEAIEHIADRQLAAACPIFNCNQYAQSDAVSPLQSPDITAAKLEAVGYKVAIIDGHSPTEIKAALSAHAENQAGEAKPFAIVAHTIKGWGAGIMQQGNLHGQAMKAEQCEQALTELDATAKELGAAWTEGDLNIPPIGHNLPAAEEPAHAPLFSEAMKQFGKAEALASGKLATRKAYGVALRALGRSNKTVVSLDGDVRGSTYAGDFAKDEELADRFVECRIAEQNMVSLAAGLGAGGKIPFASTFGKFFVRAYDQLEMAINTGANIKLVGSHSGASLGADGPSQMALPDVAFLRAWANVTNKAGNPAVYLLQPADAFATYALTMAMAEYEGACYMRTLRPDTEFLYDDHTPFNLGGHEVLTEGRDLLIVAAGYMVHEANKALDGLEEAGIDATLVDLYSMPFDGDAILDLAQENNGMVLTLEDNYAGGIGSAVAEILAEDGGSFTLKQMFIRRIPKSGRSADDLMHYCALSSDDIVANALKLMEVAS